MTFTETYPFTDLNWEQGNLANGVTIANTSVAFNTTKVLNFNKSKKIITNFKSGDDDKTVCLTFSNFFTLF